MMSLSLLPLHTALYPALPSALAFLANTVCLKTTRYQSLAK